MITWKQQGDHQPNSSIASPCFWRCSLDAIDRQVDALADERSARGEVMSRISEWRRQEGETGEQWLSRLRVAEAAGHTEGERVVFGARVWQATTALALEVVQAQEVAVLALEQGGAPIVDQAMIGLVKEACLKLSPAARQQFSAWVIAGCPEEPDN